MLYKEKVEVIKLDNGFRCIMKLSSLKMAVE